MRRRALPLVLLAPLFVTPGCIGFFNGYMADVPHDDPEVRKIRSSPFPALAADGHFLAHSGDQKPHPVGHALIVAMILADVPISAAVDAFFLPFRLISLGIHGPPNAAQAQEHGPNASRSGNVRPHPSAQSVTPETTRTPPARVPGGPVYITRPPGR